MPIDPVTGMMIAQGISKGLEAFGGSQSARRQSREQREWEARQAALQRQLTRDMGTQDVAQAESMADPFRHQMAQAQGIARLDAMQNASYAPTQVTMPERYAAYAPKTMGGFSWEPSTDVRDSAGKLKQSVMAGRTAPTMTNPDNYGKTSALNLFGDADPRTDEAFASGAPSRAGGGGMAPEAPPDFHAAMQSLRAKLPDDRTRALFDKAVAKGGPAIQAAILKQFEMDYPGWTIDPVTGKPSRRSTTSAASAGGRSGFRAPGDITASYAV